MNKNRQNYRITKVFVQYMLQGLRNNYVTAGGFIGRILMINCITINWGWVDFNEI